MWQNWSFIFVYVWYLKIKYLGKKEIKKQSLKMDAWDKCSGLVHWEDPEGWDGEHMADSCQCMAKATTIL